MVSATTEGWVEAVRVAQVIALSVAALLPPVIMTMPVKLLKVGRWAVAVITAR